MSSEHPEAMSLPDEGAELAGYTLDKRLAAGGMGAVYQATQRSTGERVAVKVLHPHFASDGDIRRRFRRESSVLAALDHPGVVRILDMGTDEHGHSYTVMELLRGQTLHELIKCGGPLPAGRLLPIVQQTCAALAAVHEHGVVHGDLKPGNIFLVDEGRGGDDHVKIVDFGLSKVHGLERLTKTGEVIGTPAYMAPELLTGEATPDGRVDTYALGVILYEALAGRQPFAERNPGKLMFDIVMGKGQPLAEAAPSTPAAVVAVVEKAMAPKRDDRYQTPAELLDAFTRAASG
jgi:serine/threonine-protein kinase